MTSSIFAKQALTSFGWRQNITIEIDSNGYISKLFEGNSGSDVSVGVLLPALANLHSHSFQRAMAGLAESRGQNSNDDFWSWRTTMYRFLELLDPDDMETIAAQVQMEMLESGYSACAEFHYLHHAQGGQRYDSITELSQRVIASAQLTGIGYTHLPVLYTQAGLFDQALSRGQHRFTCDFAEFETLNSDLHAIYKTLPSDYRLGVAPHSLRAVTHQGLDLCVEIASGRPFHIHAAEQMAEVNEVKSALGARPVDWLLKHMPVDSNWCFIHATHLDQSETQQLAESGAVVGLCPITEANLGDGIFDAPDYFSAGGHFGIGSDSNVRIALSEELRMLEVSQRLKKQQRIVLSDKKQTSNGAYMYTRAAKGGAQALGRESGEIKVGGLADLVALNDEHIVLSGLLKDALLDAWIFASSDDIVCDVWAAGRHVVTDGQHIKHDEISKRFHTTITRLRQSL